MDSRIKKIVDTLKVAILYRGGMDKPGHYIAAINTIVLKEGLTEQDEMRVLLHELGHASKHHKNYYLYNLTFSLRSKMESEAEQYMIKTMLDQYLSAPDIDVLHFNYMKFIENNELDPKYEYVVREMVLDYLYHAGSA
nr:ImmA/IrrE family metallo-endopeptidase [Enterococcus sp. 665A]